MVDRSRLPYGPPIRDVIATGDLQLMQETAEQTSAALGELNEAIRQAKGSRAVSGPLPPYGVAVRDALARGNVEELRAVAGAARASLAGISYLPVDSGNDADVRKALAEIEATIAKLEG